MIFSQYLLFYVRWWFLLILNTVDYCCDIIVKNFGFLSEFSANSATLTETYSTYNSLVCYWSISLYGMKVRLDVHVIVGFPKKF